MTLSFFVDSVPFTADVIAGTASLGGSESACLGLARALAARGHTVHLFATKLDEACEGPDHGGVIWHPADDLYELSKFIEWDLFCALRMPHVFNIPIRARLRALWNQDLLIGEQSKHQVMSVAWAFDKVIYVSEYHRKQWEGILPELAPVGWVTKNGFDPALVPTDAVKDPKRIIHITRPERGLAPLLQMWPEIRKQVPDAELRLCRYNSMYDAQGWGKVCAQYDQMVEYVNAQVGGITYLGELGKSDLYREIAEAAVMWYPGVVDFAETSCVAAVESQANGTPFIGSAKGALPETVPQGVLLTGDATSPEYQIVSVQAVVTTLNDCRRQSRSYRETQQAGREHVKGYTYEVIAAEWEQRIKRSFAERLESNMPAVLERLLHEDDATSALMLSRRIQKERPDEMDDLLGMQPMEVEAFCHRIIRGEEQGADDYAKYAIQDPLVEWKGSERLHAVAPWFKDCASVLDVACGNGSLAIGLALSHPTIRVTGVDYAEQNIVHAKEAAERVGVADRVTFIHAAVWNLFEGTPREEVSLDLAGHGPFDGLFAGEILEHVGDAPGFVDFLEGFVQDGGLIAYTVPNGPFSEMLERGIPRKRGHVHHFQHDDLTAVFGAKAETSFQYFDVGVTPRGSQAGHWLIQYRVPADPTMDHAPARQRPYAERIARTRPHGKLSVGIIAKNAGLDLARCLDSVWPIADEIVLGDTGSTDDTVEIAERYGATVVHLPDVSEDPDGFSGARNAVLGACTGEWFLWIDADEQLIGRENLWKYLDTTVYHGYAIRQNHVSIQDPPYHDKPVRLFRRSKPIRFYGAVHEQPQMGDCNTDITPALEVADVQIAHTGYLTEGIVRGKLFHRNLPLLLKDKQRFPDRRLGKLLLLRDYINIADADRERARGRLTSEAKKWYGQAVALFEAEWLDRFDDKFYGLARPFYERAVKEVAGSFEFDLGLAGKQQGLGPGRATSKRVWVRKLAHLDAIVQHELAVIHKQANPPAVDVEPIAVAQSVPVEAA